MAEILSSEQVAEIGARPWITSGDEVVALIASHEALRTQADLSFYAYNDAELAAYCGPCFEGVCECCIEQRGAAGDGQPCRCSHAGWYAEGLRRMAAERDVALNHVEAVRGLAEAAARDANRLEAERDAMQRRAEAAEADWHAAERDAAVAEQTAAELRDALPVLAIQVQHVRENLAAGAVASAGELSAELHAWVRRWQAGQPGATICPLCELVPEGCTRGSCPARAVPCPQCGAGAQTWTRLGAGHYWLVDAAGHGWGAHPGRRRGLARLCGRYGARVGHRTPRPRATRRRGEG